MSGQTIFITGGSGYVGSVVVEQAIAQGYTVRGLSRSEASDEKYRKLGAIPVRGDLASHDVLTREASNADIVINVADTFVIGQSQEVRFATNNAAIDALAAGLKGSGKPLILTGGSLMAAADPEGKETDESSPPWSTGLFKDFKKHEPRNLAYKDQGIRVCVVHLAPYVYGRGGSGVKLFMGMFARAGAGFYVDEGSARTTTVHVEDAARLYLLIAQKGRAGEAYNGTSETHVTQRQLAEAIGKQLDVPVTSQSYTDTEAKLGGFLATFLSSENRAGHAKAKKEFGWEPKAEKGILEEIEKGSYVDVAEGFKNAAAGGA